MEAEHTGNAGYDTIPYDMYTFREWVKGVRQQIDQMKEGISDAYAIAQSANALAQTHEEAISELWRSMSGKK